MDEEKCVRIWIEKISKRKFDDDLSFMENLKDGSILVSLVSKIKGKFIIPFPKIKIFKLVL